MAASSVTLATSLMMAAQVLLAGIGLLAIMLALIFRDAFRRDMLAGTGEASVLGVLSVKGAAVLVLAGLFFAAFLYPTQQLGLSDRLDATEAELHKARDELDALRTEWKITGTLELEPSLTNQRIYVLSQMPVAAFPAEEASRQIFEIRVRPLRQDSLPDIWIQPAEHGFGRALSIAKWEQDGHVRRDAAAKTVTVTERIRVAGGDYPYKDPAVVAPSEPDRVVPQEFERAADRQTKALDWERGQ